MRCRTVGVQARIGVNTGEVLPAARRRVTGVVTGDPVAVGRRLERGRGSRVRC